MTTLIKATVLFMEEENLTSSEALRKRILDLCKKRNISINHLAMMAGMPQTTVDAVVPGCNFKPSLKDNL